MKELPGKITINRWSSNREPQYGISIEIQDRISGCILIKVEMTLEEYALASTGLAYQPCQFSYNDSGVIGKKREIKVELVIIKGERYGEISAEAITKAFEPYEIDGWKGSICDAKNHKNDVTLYNGPGVQRRVTFIRYIETEPDSTATTASTKEG